MTTATVYQWSWIAQGVTVSVDVQGWDRDDAVAYCATPYPLGADADYPSGNVGLTRGVKARIDGSVTHTAVVHNRAPFHPCAVDLLAVSDRAACGT